MESIEILNFVVAQLQNTIKENELSLYSDTTKLFVTESSIKAIVNFAQNEFKVS